MEDLKPLTVLATKKVTKAASFMPLTARA